MKKRYPFLPENWLRFGFVAAFATAFSLNLQAQNVPVKQWDKTFGGNQSEQLTCMKPTADGGYILGGFSNSPLSGDKTQASKGGQDYWVVKVDADGNKVWDKTFGGNGTDYLRSLQQTADGGYILGGASDSDISGDKSQANKGAINTTDFWILKLDASGNKIWDKTFGGNYSDHLNSLQQTSDGGYVLGGGSISDIGGDKSQPKILGSGDYWIIKVDANGNKIWDKTYGGNRNDGLTALQQTADGGYIVGGTSDSDLSYDKSQALKGFRNYWIIKLDGNGNKQWDRSFGGHGIQYFTCIQQTADGGYIAGGNSGAGISLDKTQASQGTQDYWIVKLDNNGNKTWDKTFGGNNWDELYALKQTADGGYILGGLSDSGSGPDKTENNNGGSDFWILKLNSNGNKLWDKTIGGSDAEYLTSLHQTSDGYFILAGSSFSGIGSDKTQPSQGNNDYWLVKLTGSITGLKESEPSFNLTISPNPNQDKFKLHLSNLTTSKAEITVSDLVGRTVLQKEIKATDHQLSEELTLPNTKGIYLLQLKTGEQILTRKIVVE